MKPVLCRTSLTHMVPEFKWSLISWRHFFLMRESQAFDHLCLCSAMWAACWRSANIYILVSLTAKTGCNILFIFTLLAFDTREQVVRLVLVDQNRVINLTPTDIFQLLELSFWRWALQFCLTSPALGVWQTGSCCASEPDLSPASAH